MIFFILIIIQVLSATLCCYAYDSDVEATAEQMQNFSEEIDITASDLNTYLSEVFDYKPKLEFYYAGYSASSLGIFNNVTFKYHNQDININDIYIANSEQEFTDIIIGGILYCKENIYIVSKGNYSLKDIMDKLICQNQIVVMGYKGFNASTFNSNLTANTCYNINIEYNFEPTTLLNYKKATESKAMDILTQITAKSMPNYIKEEKIHDYIAEYSDYSDEDADLSYTPYNLLINGRGVCAAYAGSVKIMLDLLNLENYYISGTATNTERTENHAWNIVKLDDGYYHLDCTWDDPVTIFGFNSVEHSYFNLTDDEMAQNHTWDKSAYPQCNATKYSYENILDMKDRTKYNDNYQKSDFVSVFDTYKPLDQANDIMEYVTEQTTDKYIENANIYNSFDNLPDKHKLLIFIIIVLLLFLLLVIL